MSMKHIVTPTRRVPGPWIRRRCRRVKPTGREPDRPANGPQKIRLVSFSMAISQKSVIHFIEGGFNENVILIYHATNHRRVKNTYPTSPISHIRIWSYEEFSVFVHLIQSTNLRYFEENVVRICNATHRFRIFSMRPKLLRFNERLKDTENVRKASTQL